MAEEAGKDPGLLRRQWRRISEIPFNSDKNIWVPYAAKGRKDPFCKRGGRRFTV